MENEEGILDSVDAAKREFKHLEYQISAAAYFKGLDIGYTVVRFFLTINAIFIAGLGIPLQAQSGSETAISDIVKYIPILAIIVCFLLIGSLKYYRDHLNNCLERCQTIEGEFGGNLFSGIENVASGRKLFSAAGGLKLMVVAFMLAWGLAGAYLGTFDFVAKFLPSA